jgi:mono/diheme cytochrome c family protein
MRFLIIPAVLSLLLLGCGGQPEQPAVDTGGLSQDEFENGIGPVKEAVTLGAIDPALAEKGKTVFEQKCLSCHKLGEKFIGPDLSQVLSRRTPRYVLNMILNPDEMTKRHPVAKKLLAEYLAPMAQQNLTQDEARAVLEHIRSYGSQATAAPAGN